MTEAAGWASRTLDYTFRDPGLLEQALTHRSAAVIHNERLEYLGDAVLGLVVAELLYARRPDATEGTMSRLRARLVRGETLEEVARELELGEQLVLGSGELRTGGHHRASILANALEAVFGAVYLDRGLDAARQVIVNLLGRRFDELPVDDDLRDPKTRLQELLQARGLPLPLYKVANVSGPPHRQVFTVQCQLELLDADVTASGSSRRAAEQAAAAQALADIEATAGD